MSLMEGKYHPWLTQPESEYNALRAASQQGAAPNLFGAEHLSGLGLPQQEQAQQGNAFANQFTDALRYDVGFVTTENISPDTMIKSPRHKTFREELQYEVDQWLKNSL